MALGDYIDEESQAQRSKLADTSPMKEEEEASEDTESDPSTEFGSEGSDSEYCYGSDGEEDVVEKPFAVEDTILIFDWDDTLLPTTWIEQQGLRLSDERSKLSEEQEHQLSRMAEFAKQTLQTAKSLGEVILVTNAEEGWVELSCHKFMPSLLACLQDVKILSARSTYEQRGVAEPSEWKYLAFQSELARFCTNYSKTVPQATSVDFFKNTKSRRCNIISIGDSPHEREALIRVTEHMPDPLVKAIKLMARPEVDQFCQEHELIGGCFGDIVNHDGNLDMCIASP